MMSHIHSAGRSSSRTVASPGLEDGNQSQLLSFVVIILSAVKFLKMRNIDVPHRQRAKGQPLQIRRDETQMDLKLDLQSFQSRKAEEDV